ncbi:tubulin polymerization-promoting protein homolog [Amphibalanus amphitrite]|uniref:tubulin polymerization-promoting protein homolog n=1 Tax=Amphibalanus amphitrite TaxID=1232801 RepID=UPI001C9146E6|nr:tubulin polymerization-promoting protein homolog [Amphibalanus amphitrite]
MSESAGEQPTLGSQFKKFSVFGLTHQQATPQTAGITLSNADKWFKQAGVIPKMVTTTDTSICFSKLKQKKIDFKDFKKYLDDIAATKKIPLEELKSKLINCGDPGTNHATKAVSGGAVGRLTDTSKYTGQHKERFDESGKGKGKAGREDLHANDGYVSGYKEKGSYNDKH